MFTCMIRYVADLEQLPAFEDYARTWMSLIDKYGGTHHGYFIPGLAPKTIPEASFSFPGLGTEGPANVAVALFSFPDVATYDDYRRRVAEDEQCIAATERFEASRCFLSYERTFLRPVITSRTDPDHGPT